MEQARGGDEVVEEASPISSRPPANLEQNLIRFHENVTGTSSSSSVNRWPREETLALIKIRSEMDSNFPDSTLKASLWDNVSRKLLELGYKRSAKKCREKFENVQKYYKRTKESTLHGSRHESKTYKFFNELEALTTSSSLDVAPISVANPPLMSSSIFSLTPQTHNLSFSLTPSVTPSFPGVTFSSHSSSTASGMGSDKDDIDVDLAGPSSRKRKRGNRHGRHSKKMKLFQELVRKVLQKQSEMQQSFLETLEKKEQESLERQEAWRHQEMSRLAQEHNLMSQERAKSASRDVAIISFLEKITGQTFKLAPPSTISVKRVLSPLKQLQETQSQPIMAIPEQQILPPPLKQQERRRSEQVSSSRWPKAEILALINLRSGMEPKYQDNVPKGLLWEEISMSMQRMGYKRNAKRCKEKWENINKYYKKVKERNKKRPEDAKTCPYFHRLELLYQNKVLGGSSSFGSVKHQELVKPQDQTVQQVTAPVSAVNSGDVSEEERLEGAEKPEDLVKKKQEEDAMKVEVNKIQESEDYNLEEDEKSAAYEIEFQSSANRGGNGHKEPPFLTMVK